MPLVDAREIEKVYKEGGVETHALRGAVLAVESGEFVAIMGPSGSGKSTLLHVLGFLDRPTGGIYRFAGKTMDEYSDDDLARVRNKQMGFVFQAFNLLPRATVYENVALPLIYSDIRENEWTGRIESAVETVGLSHRMRHDTSQLSGGERQRVAIARALVNTPHVIFADEPTGNLDSQSGQVVMETIQSLNEEHGHTVVLITHEVYAAGYAERIVHLKDGSVDYIERVGARRKKGDGYVK